MNDNIICRSRIYECECGFVGAEEKALEHQCKCDLPVDQITKGVQSQ